MLHSLCLFLRRRRQLAHDVLLHHQSADRHTKVGTPSAILHIHGYGYLGVFHRGKAHKYGVVAAVVLRRTRLAACLEGQTREHLARTLQSRRPHACHNIVVCTARGLGVVAVPIERVEGQTLHLAHNMRHIVVATVGYGSAKIGYLQRRKRNLALSDGDGYDGKSVPGAVVVAVVVVGIRYHAALLAGQVDA